MPPAVVVTCPFQEDPVDLYHGASIHSDAAEDTIQDQIQALSKKLNALKGKDLFGKNSGEMCVIPNVRVLAKFKVPEFEKYKDSLSGAPLRWYMGLEHSNIQNFLDLGEAFVQHYKYNMDMTPDRTQLGSMSQKECESFKEYAQRWWEVAAQVTPPVEEKELCKLFLRTLDSFYYNKFISSMPRDFTEMVGVGVQLEEGVKEVRITRDNSTSASNTKKFSGWQKKKEGDANAVSHHRPSHKSLIHNNHRLSINGNNNSKDNNHLSSTPTTQQNPHPPKTQFQFDPILIAYTDLLPFLLLVEKHAAPPVPDKLPKWYKRNERCVFHSDAPGHDTNNCFVFKGRVQELVRLGLIKFGDTPNVETNPFPEHGAVNVITEDENLIMDVLKVKTLLVPVHLKLFKAGILEQYHEK
ncbi:uncharacterized protein LOC127080428 [Lathyrus oleraceus]|uniref:uncharacterized protein LOC127080428 n=1 Tax=Pisum sativum TaxID=3888 RepID=UPI0021CEB156|nr:uncharacterized protein LOC127080428 [Pisum sativum]